jgi:hypothetical protein
MCDRWLNSFEAFLEDMGECQPGMSLDRIDHNGNYEPGNCRWANAFTQANNTRRNVYIEFLGTTYTMAEYCRQLEIQYSVFQRYYRAKELPLDVATEKALAHRNRAEQSILQKVSHTANKPRIG